MKTILLTTRDRAAWLSALDRAGSYDYYHLPDYHQLAQDRGEGQAYCLVLESGDGVVAFPYLLRPIDRLLSQPGESALYDVTSVYGYAGPVGTQTVAETDLARRFRQELTDRFREQRVVSVFARLHPLLSQAELIGSLGEVRPLSETVSIETSLPLDLQRRGFRKGHKSDLSRLRRREIEVVSASSLAYLDEFAGIYTETMQRVGAAANYLFDQSYFHRLLSIEGVEVRVFLARSSGDTMCGGVFTLCNGIVQYHLGATRDRYVADGAMKLIIDEARGWATANGARVFHLGGGVGGSADSVFHFKAGFSPRRHTFQVWNWIVDGRSYQALSDRRAGLGGADHAALEDSRFFPRYRIPLEMMEDGVMSRV